MVKQLKYRDQKDAFNSLIAFGMDAYEENETKYVSFPRFHEFDAKRFNQVHIPMNPLLEKKKSVRHFPNFDLKKLADFKS